MRAIAMLLIVAAALFAAARPVRAQEPGSVSDSGRLVVFSHGEPVATEDFQYEQHGDSLFVTSHADRHAKAADGTVKPYMKSMELIEHADDGAILLYLSTEKFDGKKINRSVLPSDTTITVTTEKDDYFGSADKLVRLPGRLYVLDAGLFTLFDVIGRNLHGRIFGERPVALVTMGNSNRAIAATAAPAGRDTIRWGTKPVVADRITLTDSSSVFTLYTSPSGSLLRLENADADLVVMRQPPAVPAASRRRRPPPRP
jgi:hypothetical protein